MNDYYYDYSQQIDENEFYSDEMVDGVHDGINDYQPINIEMLYNSCILPSIWQIFAHIWTFLFWTIIYRLIAQNPYPISMNIRHIWSIVCGSFIIYFTLDKWAIVYICTFSVFSFIVLLTSICVFNRKCNGFIVAVFCLSTLFIGESISNEPKLWHQMRGTQMIIAMKVISASFDYDSDQNPIDFRTISNPAIYFGYLFCPGNCILGPWISITDYLSIYTNRKSIKISTVHVLHILLNGFFTFFFLISSNCLVPAAISDQSWKWFVAYRDALTFRCSHYFITFLSQMIMLMAGFDLRQTHPNGTVNDRLFGILLTKPWSIEWPRSIVHVVIVWNVSMHVWLKTYVFRIMKPYGIFSAIFTTYIISALLHGINFQLAAVLLSLGCYTFVEYRLRYKLAHIYNACILANRCTTGAQVGTGTSTTNTGNSSSTINSGTTTTCPHRYKWQHPVVFIVNVLFTILAIVHLAYLGVMFEASVSVQEQGFSYSHTLAKWSNLNFTSHWIVFFCYLLCSLI